jgi:spermidine/putrescine-binding protein
MTAVHHNGRYDRRALLARGGALSLAVLLAACGDDEGSDGGTTAPAATSTAPPSSSAPAATTSAAPASSAPEASAPPETAASSASSAATTVSLDPGSEKGALQVLDWSGYELEDFWKPYTEGPYGADHPLKFAFLETDQQALAKVAAGFETDLVHPQSGYVQDWLDAGLIQPWTVEALPEWGNVLPQLAEVSVIDGRQYQIPWDWGTSSVIYRPDKVEPTEESWSLLVDERYKGRVTFYDDGVEAVKVAGLIEGVDDPNAMDDATIESIKPTLKRLKENVRTLWVAPTDPIDQMTSGNVDIAYGWPYHWFEIRKKLADAVYLQPQEGRLGWVYGYVLSAQSERVGLAHEMMKAALSPATMATLVNAFAYGASNGSQEVLDQVADPNILDVLGYRDPASLDPPKTWVGRHLPNRRSYVAAWEEAKAG